MFELTISDLQLAEFDLGGVLVDIHHSWEEALAVVGLSASGRLERLADCPLLREYQAGRLSDDRFLELLAVRLDTDVDGAKRAHAAILRSETEGMSTIMDELRTRGHRTGCLSNTNALHWGALLAMPAIASLDFRVASHLCGHNKPEEAAYAAFESVAGAGPESMVFFDDGPANVEAARQRGWRAECVLPGSDVEDQVRAALREWGAL